MNENRKKDRHNNVLHSLAWQMFTILLAAVIGQVCSWAKKWFCLTAKEKRNSPYTTGISMYILQWGPQARRVSERRHVQHAPQRYTLIPWCPFLFDALSCFSYFINITLLSVFLRCQVGFLACGKALTYRFVSSGKKKQLLISKKMKEDLFLVNESVMFLLKVRLLDLL